MEFMDFRYDILLNPLVVIGILLLIIVPLTLFQTNRYLHKYGDPPWKQPEKPDDGAERSEHD
ncbi:hypothetical protein [Paenibacillus lautus]|uniref:hypothetical protein n=1 Tax=Paenibacillus lautus TaxID=1401 RepID=UPI003D9A2169